MTDFNNDITKNPNYITKSKITRNELKKMGIPKNISVEFVKNSFESLNGIFYKTGNPYNQNSQRHTKFVKKRDLYYQVFKDFRSISRR